MRSLCRVCCVQGQPDLSRKYWKGGAGIALCCYSARPWPVKIFTFRFWVLRHENNHARRNRGAYRSSIGNFALSQLEHRCRRRGAAMPIRRRPLGRALTAAILLVGHAAASQSQTTPRAAPAESGSRHPGWRATGRGASVPHSSTGHVASEAAPTTGAPAPRDGAPRARQAPRGGPGRHARVED